MSEEFFEPGAHETDRRRWPDVYSYRLGQVEEKANRNETELQKLERLVHDFIAAMPANFVPRPEHEALMAKIGDLTVHFETFITQVTASNAIREKNAHERQTVRLQWPVWLLMTCALVASVAGLLLHH